MVEKVGIVSLAKCWIMQKILQNYMCSPRILTLDKDTISVERVG